MSNINYLKDNALFSCFTSKQLAIFEQSTHISMHKKGRNIFDQGADADYFYFLREGIIKLVHLSSNGDERIVEIIRAGEFFAEALMFLQQSVYPVRAVAAIDSQLIAVNMKHYLHLLSTSENANLLLLGNLSKRIHGLVSDMNGLILHSAEGRVASFLINCMTTESENFSLQLPKKVIASRLSMKAETFSRALHHLCDIDVIKLTKKEVVILDKVRLSNIATEDMA